MNPWNRSRLTAKLGIEYPIFQGPLGGLSSQRLTAAVSNYGGLGSFGAHSLAPAAITDVIAQIRSLTSQSFAMNLWVSMAIMTGHGDRRPVEPTAVLLNARPSSLPTACRKWAP
jgi:NAD(P)H-dependent flavin oxidoreductase YrpB (nitropropane dioxygenase family)